MPTNPWILLGLLAFSIAVTLAADWLVGRLRRPATVQRRSPATILADLLWMLLLFVAGLIAARYIERIPNPIPGYLAFGLAAIGLSLFRAYLFQRSRDAQRPLQKLEQQEAVNPIVHNLAYVLSAIVLYLALSLLVGRPADPILFIPLCIAALLPDLDSQSSAIGRLLPSISRRLEGRFGHQEEWHSLAAAVFVGLLATPLILLASVPAWAVIPLGFVSHLLVDLLSPKGVMLLWPVMRTHLCILDGPVSSYGNAFERKLILALGLVAIILLLAVDLGRPAPPTTPAPTYEQSLARYYGIRGNNLAIASVSGTWQATGRRISGRFEILNASGESYVMLDRYTGDVFTAGRDPADDLYLNGVRVQTGDPVEVKAVEVHLEDETLAGALPVLYQIQREPGLQHIYISGDVLVPALQDATSPALPVDFSQTRLRRIQAHEPGHYTLHYLSAGDLIELGNVQVELADLVIVATSVPGETGPTPTPLPSPPAPSDGD